MKLYLIQWGYYSCEGHELDSIWTDKDVALKHLHNEASGDHLSKKDKNFWTNNDKWMEMVEVNADSPWLHGDPDEN